MSFKIGTNEISFFGFNPTGTVINEYNVNLRFPSSSNVTVGGSNNTVITLAPKSVTWADSRVDSSSSDPRVITTLSFTSTSLDKSNSTEVSGTGGLPQGDARNSGMSYAINRTNSNQATLVNQATDVPAYSFDVINGYSRIVGVMFK